MTIHMLKERAGPLVTTRCRTEIKMKSGQTINDIGVTSRESLITCPDCILGHRQVTGGSK